MNTKSLLKSRFCCLALILVTNPCLLLVRGNQPKAWCPIQGCKHCFRLGYSQNTKGSRWYSTDHLKWGAKIWIQIQITLIPSFWRSGKGLRSQLVSSCHQRIWEAWCQGSRLPSLIIICILYLYVDMSNKYQKYKSVELDDLLMSRSTAPAFLFLPWVDNINPCIHTLAKLPSNNVKSLMSR